jgi:sugar (pentulose or hexulose) kinase
MKFSLGIDFGTSGARAIAIDSEGAIAHQTSVSWLENGSSNNSDRWQQGLYQLCEQIPVSLRQEISAIAFDGTSGTVLLCDERGSPLTEPILYNDRCAGDMVDKIREVAPAGHPVLSATSSLAKLLWWRDRHPHIWQQSRYLLHQADWLGFLLHGRLGISDYHNALKLGYDPGSEAYPDWLLQGFSSHLTQVIPHVVAPGSKIAPVRKTISDRFQFPANCTVCAGTTDSIAAFLASGAQQPGEAVTSLGSTLAIKLLSQQRVDASRYGIYSHRLGDLWLAGGASNTGGVVLKQYFSDEEIAKFSRQMSPEPSDLNYYPLPEPGERFPVNDPNLPPQLEPQPESRLAFFHGILDGIARVEKQGYQLLQQLGATPVKQVYTAGGGASNQNWSQLRQQYLQVPVVASAETEAAYGTALLAMKNGLS